MKNLDPAIPPGRPGAQCRNTQRARRSAPRGRFFIVSQTTEDALAVLDYTHGPGGGLSEARSRGIAGAVRGQQEAARLKKAEVRPVIEKRATCQPK